MAYYTCEYSFPCEECTVWKYVLIVEAKQITSLQSVGHSMNRQGTTLKAIIPAEVKTWQFLWP